MRLKSGNKGTQYGFEILHCKLLRPCLGLGQKKEWLLMVVTEFLSGSLAGRARYSPVTHKCSSMFSRGSLLHRLRV
jgi:hypothetical protein